LLLKLVLQVIAEDVVEDAEAVEEIEEIEVIVQTVATVQIAATEVTVATAEASEDVDVVVHAEEPTFLKSTTPRRSPAWAHSTLTLTHITNLVCTNKDLICRSNMALRGT
jgi:hypothetical protein